MTVAPRFALTPGLLFALFMSVTATAIESPLKGLFSAKELTSGPGKQCGAVFERVERECFIENEAVGVVLGKDLENAAAGIKGGRESGAGMEVGGQVSVTVNASAGERCGQAYKQCKYYCEQATEQVKLMNSVNGAYMAELAELNKITKSLCPVFLHQANMHFGSASQGIAASTDGKNAKDASTAGSFLKDNWGKIAIGTIGVAAIHNLTKGGGGGGSGGGGTGAPGSPSAGGTNGGAPDCTTDDAAKNLLCDGQLLTECSNLANVASAKCTAFTDRHCGFAAASGQINNAPGLGSKLCSDAMAGKYCKNEAKAKCYSCLSLKDRQTERCLANPQSCTHENTTQEMGYFKHSCPDDPVFSDLKWASVVATPLPANTALPSVSGGETNTLVGQPPGLVGQPPTDSSEMMGDLGTAVRVPAEVLEMRGADIPSDTGPRIGVSVFSQSTQTLQLLCGQGKLNSCGLRRSILSRSGP